jgi:hypothetical protein
MRETSVSAADVTYTKGDPNIKVPERFFGAAARIDLIADLATTDIE